MLHRETARAPATEALALVRATLPADSAHIARVTVFDDSYPSTLTFLNSLGVRGIPVHVYGRGLGCAARWSRYCTRYDQAPSPEDSEQFLPWLRARIRSGEIQRIAPTTDLIAYYASLLREEFSPSVRRTIAPLAEVEQCLIKTRFAERCAQTGHAAPPGVTATTLEAALAAASQLGYPVMLKPASHLGVGMGERGCVVNTSEELQAHFAPYAILKHNAPLVTRYPELRWPMLQQFLPDAARRVYSVSGIKDATHGVLAASVSYKAEQWPPQIGVSARQVGTIDQAVLAEGLALVDSLLSCGIFELELVWDRGKLLAIDLNPRGFGFMALDIARGNDLPWLWYQTTLAPQLPRPPRLAAAAPLEYRFALPFYAARAIEVLRGPNRFSKLRQAWSDLRQPTVLFAGFWRDPLPHLVTVFSVLRHPGGLLRPIWRKNRGA